MNERPDDNSSISNEKLEIEVSFVQDRPFEKSEAEKKLVKKINRTFMPYACAILFIQVNPMHINSYTSTET
jgi:hypothetical protein